MDRGERGRGCIYSHDMQKFINWQAAIYYQLKSETCNALEYGLPVPIRNAKALLHIWLFDQKDMLI